MKRKIALILAAVFAAVSLAGCSGDKEPLNNNSSESQYEETFTEEDVENSKKWLTIEDNVLVSCSFDATKVVIPDGVTKIENDAFAGCASLTLIQIPDSVTEIDTITFLGCKKSSIIYKGKTYNYDQFRDFCRAING